MKNIDLKTTKVQFIEPKAITRKYTREMFGKETWIPVDQIKIDFEVQRELDENHSKFIAKRFDPASFGRVTVTQREATLEATEASVQD